jgi:hypothetical protein
MSVVTLTGLTSEVDMSRPTTLTFPVPTVSPGAHRLESNDGMYFCHTKSIIVSCQVSLE